MLLLDVTKASGILIVTFVIQTWGQEIGFCERTEIQEGLDDNGAYNVTIRECCEGFLAIGGKCIAICTAACINAVCIGENKCQCFPGYHAVSDFLCLATCEPPCGSDLVCKTPNKCFCKPGYKSTDDDHCEPICSFTDENFECLNAKCVGLNECECFEGYKNVSNFLCEPICSNCLNGHCVSPEVCECINGYDKDSSGICRPTCNPKCQNAVCTAPNTCKCNENFESFANSFECFEKRIELDCIDNAICFCKSGYEMFNGKCLKNCDGDGKCVNGRCLDDQCICPENFKLTENSECLPVCSFEDGHDCIGGICVAPQTCECLEGFEFLDDRRCICIPKCVPACVNAICTATGCQCHENFEQFSENECRKNCSEGFSWLDGLCSDNEKRLEDGDDGSGGDGENFTQSNDVEAPTTSIINHHPSNMTKSLDELNYFQPSTCVQLTAVLTLLMLITIFSLCAS